MKIQIELLVIVIIALIFFLWAVWFRWSARRARKKYNKRNPDNDTYKTRKGGEERGSSEDRRGEQNIDSTSGSVPRPIQPAERELLPVATDDSPRKNRSRFGNAIRRARRKK